MLGFAEDEGMPYLLTTEDVFMGCAMTEAFTPFLLSFSKVTTPPGQLAIMFYLLAGNCAEFKAWEEELRYLRSIHAKNALEAEDARIAQQRWLYLAARRQLKAYQYLLSVGLEPGGQCPEFKTDNEEFFWMMGLVSGLQAIINDMASQGSAEVPLDIAAKVGRSAACLDNNKWWGLPAAMQAAIWITIPGQKPVDRRPVEVMDQAITTGLQQGMRIAQVLAAQVALGQGEITRVKEIIRKHAAEKNHTPGNPAYKFLDEAATRQIQAISDRLWTQATGKRTPIGGLGTFWDDSGKAVETIDIDDML